MRRFFRKATPTRATTSSSLVAPPAPAPPARTAWATVRGEILAWCRDELSRNGGDFGLPILDYIFDRVIRYTRGDGAAFQEVEEFTGEERELLNQMASAVTMMTICFSCSCISIAIRSLHSVITTCCSRLPVLGLESSTTPFSASPKPPGLDFAASPLPRQRTAQISRKCPLARNDTVVGQLVLENNRWTFGRLVDDRYTVDQLWNSALRSSGPSLGATPQAVDYEISVTNLASTTNLCEL
ncbi:hypothetical protein B0T21DRAFT_433765 [Apiosordaria backusii]|uniref:Uncharacterized protein n=1 Tax=Apiosordaria backusii TaxID=314023 RepID=A0AA40EMI9_9PEZI|nr:hypothetical protein B0T21DRAFT_433765 [Apiosordaria backusii]